MFRRTITWVDVGHRERLTNLTSQSGAPDTYAALTPLSNATPTTWHEGEVEILLPSSLPVAQYATVDVIMAMSCQDADSHNCHVFFPAPAITKMLADELNRNGATAEWTILEAALSSLSVPFSGLPIVNLLNATAIWQGQPSFETFRNYNTGITWGRRTSIWRDSVGKSSIHHLAGPIASLTTAPTLAMIAAMEETVSTAAIYESWQGELTVFADPIPTSDEYNSVNDYARMWFADDLGNRTSIVIPAPARAIFLADGKTVNASQANVAIFIAAVLTEIIHPQSELLVSSFIGGSLAKGRREGY